MERLEVNLVTAKERNGEKKSRWTRVGAAFPNKTGGYSLVLDHAIAAVPGVTDIVLSVPKPKDEGI
jgi:hypothetical protein